jgi:capsular exopolysaccharide synthesis family protein
MDLKGYFVILRRNIWVILSTLVVTVAVVTVVTVMITPIYTASCTLRVATAASGVMSYSDYMYADRLLNTYTKLATSRPILDELANNLKLQTAPQVTVVTIPNTELIKISVDSPNPQVAQNSANSLAEILMAQAKQLYAGEGKSTQDILGEQLTLAENDLTQARQEYDTYVSQHPGETEQIAAMDAVIQLKQKTYNNLLSQYDQARIQESIRANIISIVEPAIFPLTPSKPSKALNIGLGFLVGLAGGVGLAFLFENLGTRLYTSKQIEAAVELNPIGKIPTMERRGLFSLKKPNDENLHTPFDENLHTPFREAFRRLMIQISMQNPNDQERTALGSLLITSSEPGEGKSTIAVNLAMAFAQSGKRVIVVDCDLHMPKQHQINGLSNKVGVSTLLIRMTHVEDMVQQSSIPGMYVLTSGPLPPNPTKILEGPQIISLIKCLSQQYDAVIVDSPAFLVLADTALLAPIVDGVILVARRNFSQEGALKETYRQLADIKAHMIGLVVNEAEPNGTYYYYRHR